MGKSASKIRLHHKIWIILQKKGDDQRPALPLRTKSYKIDRCWFLTSRSTYRERYKVTRTNTPPSTENTRRNSYLSNTFSRARSIFNLLAKRRRFIYHALLKEFSTAGMAILGPFTYDGGPTRRYRHPESLNEHSPHLFSQKLARRTEKGCF